MISAVALKSIPRRDSPRKGTAKLESLVVLVLGLPPDQALAVPAADRREALRIAQAICRLLRDRGAGCRSRTALTGEAWHAYVWLEDDGARVSPSRKRKT